MFWAAGSRQDAATVPVGERQIRSGSSTESRSGAVAHAPGGALAAADNYVATGITASLDPNQLRQFANSVVDPAARRQFIATSQAMTQAEGLPPGARVIGSVVAHRLNSFDGRTADTTAWALSSYWDGGVEPTQYSSPFELSLRWSDSQWQIESVRESVPGPVPALVGDGGGARTSGVWDQALSGMSSPLPSTATRNGAPPRR